MAQGLLIVAGAICPGRIKRWPLFSRGYKSRGFVFLRQTDDTGNVPPLKLDL